MKKTTEQILAMATEKLTGDITSLSGQRDRALSIFRQTANDLGTINSNLTEKVQQMEQLSQFIGSEIKSANKMVADNEAVRARILEIIGE